MYSRHHFGEDVGEDEDLAGALRRIRKVAEHLADQLAVHLPSASAHLLVPTAMRFRHAELQL